MRALIVRRPRSPRRDDGLLELATLPEPTPMQGELLVRVAVCGVCRTDLDIVEGRIIPPCYPLIPGHQVVGRVVASMEPQTSIKAGDRVGIAWIHAACGVCQWCHAGAENLCPAFQSTGCDTPGGYAEYLTVPAAFAHVIPDELTDEQAAPLLCAGAIGWRSLRLAKLGNGEPLGLVGFGASGHLVLQLAQYRYPLSPVFVFTRNSGERAFATALGATWTGDVADTPPDRMGAVIDTTPAWKPVIDTLHHQRHSEGTH